MYPEQKGVVASPGNHASMTEQRKVKLGRARVRFRCRCLLQGWIPVEMVWRTSDIQTLIVASVALPRALRDCFRLRIANDGKTLPEMSMKNSAVTWALFDGWMAGEPAALDYSPRRTRRGRAHIPVHPVWGECMAAVGEVLRR